MFDFDFSSIYSNLESLCKSALDNGYFTDNTIAGFVQQGAFDAENDKLRKKVKRLENKIDDFKEKEDRK